MRENMSKLYSLLEKNWHVVLVAVLIATGLLVVFTAYSSGKEGGANYTYTPVEDLAKQYLCSECHREQLVFSKEAVPHPFLPLGIDHGYHLKAAIRMATIGNTTRNYPACYTCHTGFTAEEGLNATVSIKICTECHNPYETRFHGKVYEKHVSCTLCHSDWSGGNWTVRILFNNTLSACMECHVKNVVGHELELKGLHTFHGKLLECSSCHDTLSKTHEGFIHGIIASLNTTCTECHRSLGLHLLHIKSKPGIKCTTCHSHGIGVEDYTTSLEALDTCTKCHSLNKTGLHDYMALNGVLKYNCITCHYDWVDKLSPLPRKAPEACNKCHYNWFTVERSYGLHRVHLATLLRHTCSNCHSDVTGNTTHAEWIRSGLNMTRCTSCHSYSYLETSHRNYFQITMDCFSSSCHSPTQWKWPSIPSGLGEPER